MRRRSATAGSAFVPAVSAPGQAVPVPVNAAMSADVLKELSRQAARQDDLATAVAQLTQSVERLRQDLVPGVQGVGVDGGA